MDVPRFPTFVRASIRARAAVVLAIVACVPGCGQSSGDTAEATGGTPATSAGGPSTGSSTTGASSGTGGSVASATGSGGASAISSTAGAGATGAASSSSATGSGGSISAGAGGSSGTGGSATALYSTTFNCPEIDENTWIATGVVGCDGLKTWGGWKTSNGSADQITSAANYPNGGGGRGFRHFRGDGINNNGGGIRYEPSSALSEVWIRYHARYQTGFGWTPAGTPNYTKDLYVNVGSTTGVFTLGFHSQNTWGIAQVDPSGPSIVGSPGWGTVMGGTTGDGAWHCYQAHVKFDTNGGNGVGETWVDGQQTHSSSNLDWGTTGGFGLFVLGENAATISGCPNDCYTDFDDFAVSVTGPLACL